MGRLKDLIIVRGRSYYPQDIEDAATKSDPRLRPGCLAAFEVTDGGEQRIVPVAEPSKSAWGSAADVDGETVDEIWQSAREGVMHDPGLPLTELVIIERGETPKTSSGKIQRRATRDAYLDGELTIWASREVRPRSGSAGVSVGGMVSRVGRLLSGDGLRRLRAPVRAIRGIG